MLSPKIQEARDSFELYSKGHKKETSCWAWVGEDGKMESESSVCHAGLNLFGKKFPLHVMFNSFQDLGKGVTKDQALSYTNWLINTSPYSEAFITKDPLEAFEHNYVVNPNIPGKLMLGAMMASRVPTEMHDPEVSRRIFVWDKFVSMGVDPTRAYVYTSLFMRDGDTKGITFKGIYGGHWPFYPSEHPVDYSLNFINRDMVNKNELYSKTFRCDGASSLWEGVYKNKASVTDFVRSIRPRENKKIKNLNIFWKMPIKNGYVFTTDQEIKDLANQLDTWFDEQNNKRVKVG